MTAATGNAAAAWSGNLPAGTGIILRGGDTWHEGDSGASPYTGGTWALNSNPGAVGTQAHPIYFGVDLAWYSGSSWARPIITWDNPVTTSTSLSSCAHASNNVLDFSGDSWIIVDNFELTGVCATSANWEPIYLSYGSMSGGFFAYNLYMHGSSHVAFSDPTNCTALNQCQAAFRGSVNGGFTVGDVAMFNVVDFSDSDGVPMNGCFCGSWNFAYNYFNNISQFITRSTHVFHDNWVNNFVNNGHANVMESAQDIPGPSNAYAFYNNRWSNLYVNSPVNSNVCFWPGPIPLGSTLYWFNNVAWNIGACELFNIGQNNTNQGTIAIFNSTFQNIHRTDGGGNSFSCSAVGNSDPYANANILFISDDVSGSFYTANCSGKGTDITHSLLTNAAANAAGLTGSQVYAYSPTSASSPTVNKGTNIGLTNLAYCTALTAAAAIDSTLSDAAASCGSDTRYGIAYNSSNHTVSYPGRPANARPASSAWDIGAYQFGSGPPSPNGLTTTVTPK